MAEENTTQTQEETVAPAEPTVKELQAEAISLGMPKEDAETFKTKAPLQATINALKAMKAKSEVEVSEKKPVEKVATIEEKENPAEEKLIARQYKSKAEAMRSKLEKQPKVRFFLPCEGSEKPGIVREVMIKGRKEQVYVSGAVETVQLNGFKFLIPKGNFIDVPQQVAEVLSDAMRLTQNAGANFLIDRVDPETGRKVSEQL